MKPEAQRIAIAEACGWTAQYPEDTSWKDWLRNPAGELKSPDELPDYLNDLNAMHEAEETMTDDEVDVFVKHLSRAVVDGPRKRGAAYYMWHATAAQRAEAFLRMKGKWREAND